MNTHTTEAAGPDDNRAMLADSARRYFERNPQLATARDGAAPQWATFAEMGWLALPLPEADGGIGGSLGDLCALAEEFGRANVADPFIACAVLAAILITDAPASDTRTRLLAELAEGRRRVAFAGWDARKGFDAGPVYLRATGDGMRLSGGPLLAPGGDAADGWLVVADISDTESGLFLVASDAAQGLHVQPQRWYDGQQAALLTFEQTPAMLLARAPHDQRQALVARATNRTLVAHCAETVGLMQAAYELTLAYTGTRKQFGRAIATNQVVQHRLVDLMVEIAEARALTLSAATAIDMADPEAAHTVRCARAYVAQAARHVWQESVQLHGAIGMTEECGVGAFVKRLASACTVYGSAIMHLEQVAAWRLDAEDAAA